MLRLLAFCIALAAGTDPAAAHLASDSYLHIDIATAGGVSGRWDIALRDLDVALGLDANADGEITWGELRAKRSEIEAYAFGRLSIGGNGGSCALRSANLMVDYHAGNAYAVLPFTADCPAAGGRLTLNYRLLFDLDPTHRGLLAITHGSTVVTDVLTPDHAGIALELAPQPVTSEIIRFAQFGFDHILLGYDHLLFVAVLLVTASFSRVGRRAWLAIDGFGRVVLETIKILTAFTTAHATTLTLAVLGVINVPSRLVDPAIALTIMLAALDNIWPILPRLRWRVAFLFGLIHGLAFASALGPMGLPPLRLALALGCFNLGVEGGQFALALLLVPIVFAMRRDVAYLRVIVPTVSLTSLLLAGTWLIDRAFGLDPQSLLTLAAAG